MKMKRILSFLMALLTLSAGALAEDGQVLTLFAVNVGKGDALLVNCGSHTYLIDTGTAEHWGDLSRALTLMQVTHLTGVIITHTDKDHCGGAWALATSGIRVDNWYASRYYEGVKEKKHPAVQAAGLRGQQVTFLAAGDELPLGTGRLSVIGPISASETENCNSLVLVAEAGGGRMLLAGDMEFPEENELILAGAIPACQVLKVGNHGEGDATSEALLRRVQPRIAVISTSTAEEPDTPDLRVASLLHTTGVQVYETQDAAVGVMVTLEDGQAQAQLMGHPDLPPLPAGIRLSDRDAYEDCIHIRNESMGPVDVSGWYIVSARGGEMLVLPRGTVIAPNNRIVVTSLSSEASGDVVWPEKNVWHKSKDDAASLFDCYGRLVYTLE